MTSAYPSTFRLTCRNERAFISCGLSMAIFAVLIGAVLCMGFAFTSAAYAESEHGSSSANEAEAGEGQEQETPPDALVGGVLNVDTPTGLQAPGAQGKNDAAACEEDADPSGGVNGIGQEGDTTTAEESSVGLLDSQDEAISASQMQLSDTQEATAVQAPVSPESNSASMVSVDAKEAPTAPMRDYPGKVNEKLTASAGSATMRTASVASASSAKVKALSFEGVVCTIASMSAKSKVVDVAGGSAKTGAEVQLYGSNYTPAQRWVFRQTSDGYYQVVNVNSGLVLTVKGGKAAAGARIQQSKRGSSLAQKWDVVKIGNGSYRIISALASGYALSISGKKAKNGAALQLSTTNGSKLQKWYVNEAAQPVKDGFYTVACTRSGKVLDVADGSLKNGANIQQYESNGTFAQVFSVKFDEKTGYYTLRNVATCKMLDVKGGTKPGANVRQRIEKASNAQKWAIVANANGSYSFFSAVSGLALDVYDGSKKNGANVQLYTANGTAAQKWKLKKVSTLLKEGTYLFTTASSTSKAVSVKSNARKEGSAVIASKRTSANGQLWYLRSKGSGSYTLQNPYSGLYLNAGSAVGSTARLGAEHQEWLVSFTDKGFSLKLKANKKVAFSTANAASNGALRTAKAGNAKSQRFLLTQKSLISEGVYVIHSAKSWDKVMDVEDASTDNRANVQLYKSNNSVAQKWDIQSYSDGTYFIANVESGRVLDIENGSKSPGANVWMYGRNKTSAQRWNLVLDENTGALSFVSKSNSKLVIELEKDSAANGTNVRVSTNKGAASQQWSLSSTTYKPSNRWDKLKRKYLYDDGVRQLIFVKYTGGTGADAELYVKEDNVWEQKVSCRANVGERGVGETEEGLARTPTGNFAITGAFGILSNPGTAGMDYLKVTSAHYWCGDSHYYNQLVDINEKPHDCLGEHLVDYPGAYDYGLFFDYNTNPIRLGKGSAFFFHCSTSTPYTAGCVAVSRDNMVAILSYMQDGARLCIYDK